MKVDGSYIFAAPRQEVWDSLQDPDVLAKCIPGCEGFQPAGEDAYEIELKIGVGPIVGSYAGRVNMSEQRPPDSYKLIVEGGGLMGTARGEALLTFSESGGETTVKVEADSQVTGVVARVGQRMMGSASKMLMNQFFDCLRSRIEGEKVVS